MKKIGPVSTAIFSIIWVLIVILLFGRYNEIREIKEKGIDDRAQVLRRLDSNPLGGGTKFPKYLIKGKETRSISTNRALSIGSSIDIIYVPSQLGELEVNIEGIDRPLSSYISSSRTILGRKKHPTIFLLFLNVDLRISLFAITYTVIFVTWISIVAWRKFRTQIKVFKEYEKNRKPYNYSKTNEIVFEGMTIELAKEKLEEYFNVESVTKRENGVEFLYSERRNSSNLLRFISSDGKISKIY